MKLLPGLGAVLCLLMAGCSREGGTLGTPVLGAPVTVASVDKSAPESSVVLRGVMTRKCPVAGCWFMLQDETGTIKIDTKNAGFVVVEVPLNSTLTVAGRVATNDTGRYLDATGVRY